MKPGSFESASGLRLAAAFLLVMGVLGLVALKAFKITTLDPGEQPRNLKEQRSPEVTFDLVDRSGVPLAFSIERMELVAFPNALWQAHTPDQLLPRLAAALGWSEARMREALLPEMKNGWVEVREAPFHLDAVEAQAVQEWIARGSTDPEQAPNRMLGFEVRSTGVRGEYFLAWQPLLVLSGPMREQHHAHSTVVWTRRIADDLITCLFGPAGKKELESNEREITAARKAIWDALLPLHFKRVLREVPPEVSMRVYELLRGERVRDHQLKLVPVNKRVYPVRDGAEAGELPMEVVGSWGMLDEEEARERARRELHFDDDRELSPLEQSELEARSLLRLSYPCPTNGLELLGYQLLQKPEFAWIERDPERYFFLASYVPRRAPQRFYQADLPGDPTPRVVTTIDVGLQRHMRVALEQVLEQHKPALAMAIAIEVATGKVLAVDAVDAYETSGFLPVIHTFTPGSTMKVIVMASALDTDSVRLDERFNTFNGHFVLDGKRPVHEAEGAQSGWLTPEEGLAYSCNAVLMQIGLRTPVGEFRARLDRLGYGQYTRSGLGADRKGLLPTWPWDRLYKHASLCIGHEMQTTLWQHAAALATVVRGGCWMPLTLVEAVDQGSRHEPLGLPEPSQPVFRPQTCETVRSMMQSGARFGTGKGVRCDELVMGTKTGTAQKVGNEVCLHTELDYQRSLAHGGARRTREDLRAHKPHAGSCYTCSMCTWGRLPDSQREVMVLVVVDEPRGVRHYGSEIAGPAAVSILKEALGYTHGGVRAPGGASTGFAPFDEDLTQSGAKPGAPRRKDKYDELRRGLGEQPWREDAHASR